VKEDDVNLSSWYGQQIPFNSIVSSGALVKQSNGTYGQGGGYTMAWDNCSDTPVSASMSFSWLAKADSAQFLYDTKMDTVVTYDDTYSLGDKAAYAKSQGMAGCFTWSMDQVTTPIDFQLLVSYLRCLG
jgi:chitinase